MCNVQWETNRIIMGDIYIISLHVYINTIVYIYIIAYIILLCAHRLYYTAIYTPYYKLYIVLYERRTEYVRETYNL